MARSRILVVEDSAVDQKIVAAALAGVFDVVIVGAVAAAHTELGRQKFDLVLLDVDLPDGNGFRLVSELRNVEATKRLPVFFLTMKTEVPDEVMGFAVGADDYLTKPVDPARLRARVEAKLRNLEGEERKRSLLENAGLRLDFSLQRATLIAGGVNAPVDLTPLEFKILAHLMRHEEHVFSRAQLIDRIWGDNVNVIDRTVDMHVSNLRRKIAGSGYTVLSLRGVGYRFTKDEPDSGVKK